MYVLEVTLKFFLAFLLVLRINTYHYKMNRSPCAPRDIQGLYHLLFNDCVPDNFTEELLEKHDSEVQTVRQYYEDHQEILEKVSRRQQLWLEFLEFEVRSGATEFQFNLNFWTAYGHLQH